MKNCQRIKNNLAPPVNTGEISTAKGKISTAKGKISTAKGKISTAKGENINSKGHNYYLYNQNSDKQIEMNSQGIPNGIFYCSEFKNIKLYN